MSSKIDNKKNNTNLNLTGLKIDTTDKLYVPYSYNYKECLGYWMCTPASGNTLRLYAMQYDGIITVENRGYLNYGIRPVVSLPSSVKATKGSDGKWTFSD